MNRRIKLAMSAGGVAVIAAGGWAAGGGMGYASTHRSVSCSVPSATYATIAAAVGDSACATVKVSAGTYRENVTVARSLTLLGARAGEDARTRRRGRESVVGTSSAAAFTITADNVTVDGFTVDGPANTGTAAFVMQQGNSGETVQNTIINNPGRAASITTDRTTFRRNAVRNTPGAQDGFQANSRPVRDLTIGQNTFSGANPASGYNADVTVIEGNANVVVEGNRSTGDGTLVALFKTTGARVSGNTVVGGGGSSAIYVGGANTDVVVAQNAVSKAGSAVKVANSFGDGVNSRTTISRNTFHGNQYGVNVAAGSTANPVQVTRNGLTGNTTAGVLSDPAAGATTIATCDWWGSPAGPGRVPNATVKPWLTRSDLGSPCRQ